MEEAKKLYVGNLDYATTEESLRGFMEEKGITPKVFGVIRSRNDEGIINESEIYIHYGKCLILCYWSSAMNVNQVI